MPKENIFHKRHILSAKLNDTETGTPFIVSATAEELTHPNNHFNMTEEEKKLSRLQLFIKKGKMFSYNHKKPITKITGLAGNKITIFGKPHQISPASIMQNEETFSYLKEKSNEYLKRVLREDKEETYLSEMTGRLYHIIKNSSPFTNEVIHLVTMERDLAAPDAGKNRLTAEFSTLLLSELRKMIEQKEDSWKIRSDRILSLKQRTSRAESYGIHRLAQQPLMLYQSRNTEDEITPREKVIIVDDHIQAGAAVYHAASEIMDNGADLLGIVCITAHKNNQFLNIQPEVREFITGLLPNGPDDISRLNEILDNVGLCIETLTNIEGMILCAILSDPKNQEHKSVFEFLLKKYDASELIGHSLFTNQENSLLLEFEKPRMAFENFEIELLAAVKKGRFTVPYIKQPVLSDEDGQNIAKEIHARANLPWLLFDFDDTLHNLSDSTFIIFQNIIKTYSGMEVPVETIKETRQSLKAAGEYQYQHMLISFIKQYNPEIQIFSDDITKSYHEHKNEELFKPKMSKEDFLGLRNKYRIGIITNGSCFEQKVPKIRGFYEVDIDGYINYDGSFPQKPDTALFYEFCRIYDVKTKPIAYVGDSEDFDGGMAKNANIKFIKVDPTQSMIDMEEFTEKLNAAEHQSRLAKERWKALRRYSREFLFKNHDRNNEGFIRTIDELCEISDAPEDNSKVRNTLR